VIVEEDSPLPSTEPTVSEDDKPAARPRGFAVSHVLYKEQIKHLVAVGKWPFAEVPGARKAVEYDPYAGLDDDASGDEAVVE
jgi:hypothetical protein